MSRSELIYNAVVVDSGTEERGWLLVRNGLIAARSAGDVPPEVFDSADIRTDARGALLMPGAIDVHVHFREPGLTHKATIASESRAAVAGGVTSFVDMPNCIPTTTSLEAWEQKCEIAARTSAANYGFYIGATADNIDQLLRADYSRIAGVKLFMGSSTGNMCVADSKALQRIFAEVDARISIHAESDTVIAANIERLGGRQAVDAMPMSAHARVRSAEACVRATEAAMELASRYGSRLHICHVTTAAECSLLDAGDLSAKKITAEVSPHHLHWTDADYAVKGSRIKMNPAVKTAADRDALRQALRRGRIDLVATDHAPHLLSEKQGGPMTAVSGAPMVQFSLPLMLHMTDSPAFVAEKMAHAPARLFGIEGRGYLRCGYKADMALVERLDTPRTVTDADVLSLCGWTPLHGDPLRYRVLRTWVNGSPTTPADTADPTSTDSSPAEPAEAALTAEPLTFTR